MMKKDKNKVDTISKRWLNPGELFEKYTISKSTQAKYRMRKSKIKIPFSKLGGKFIRYDSIEIDKWLENHKVNL